MSDMGNERPAGWYHAEGDPPGSQRYWDGSAWQGGPQAAPTHGDAGGFGVPGGSPDSGDYKGFFGSLFDFDLTSFITPKIIRVVYMVMVVLILLGGVLFLVGSLASGGSGVVVGIIVVPLVTLFYLIMIRIYTEVVIVLFRTHDEVRKLSKD